MKKLFLILFLFIGLLGTTHITQAQKPSDESWLEYSAKTLWKSEYDFSVGGMGWYSNTTEKDESPNINLMNNYRNLEIRTTLKYKNIYLGSLYSQTRGITTGYSYGDEVLRETFNTNNRYYLGYSINSGNVYEIIHKADNIPHKIFKRFNFVPLYMFSYHKNNSKHIMKPIFTYMFDITIPIYMKNKESAFYIHLQHFNRLTGMYNDMI